MFLGYYYTRRAMVKERDIKRGSFAGELRVGADLAHGLLDIMLLLVDLKVLATCLQPLPHKSKVIFWFDY